MGPELRLRAGLDLTELSRRLLIQGIRSRNPDYTDEQVRLAMISEWLGEQDFFRAFGGISAPTP
jgi:hypothetical protein